MNHVALVIPTIDRIGGAERQVTLLAMGLSARGWRVTVVALAGSGGDTLAGLTAAGVGFYSLEMRKGLADPRGWMRMHRWLQRECPDVVHAHLPHAAWLARWSRTAAPMRVLVDTIHTSATGTAGRRIGYRMSRGLADCVTAVGEGVRDAYLAEGMVRAERCVVVPNGVDTEAWRPDRTMRGAGRNALGVDDEFLWLAAGRLEPVKDFAALLSAFAKLRGRAVLAIAGAGLLDAELCQLARTLGIADRVRFLGFVADLRGSMQAADGFVLSSRQEGLPMVLIEAAASGLPAVATDIAGTREVIVDGKTGYLAPPADAELLSAKMAALMEDSPERRETMSVDARELSSARFSLGAVLDRWEQLYRELLERNPAPRRWSRGF